MGGSTARLARLSASRECAPVEARRVPGSLWRRARAGGSLGAIRLLGRLERQRGSRPGVGTPARGPRGTRRTCRGLGGRARDPTRSGRDAGQVLPRSGIIIGSLKQCISNETESRQTMKTAQEVRAGNVIMIG